MTGRERALCIEIARRLHAGDMSVVREYREFIDANPNHGALIWDSRAHVKLMNARYRAGAPPRPADDERDDEVMQPRTAPCPACRGLGRDKSGARCAKCSGTGRIPLPEPDDDNDDDDEFRSHRYEFGEDE